MNTWTISLIVEAPEGIDQREVESMVDDAVGDEVYNRYGEGNAYGAHATARS
jgi:hypothetical protein